MSSPQSQGILRPNHTSHTLRNIGFAVLLLTAAGVVDGDHKKTVAPAQKAAGVSPGDWPAYGRDSGGSRYSPLSEINRDNVKQLKVAWTYRTGEAREKFVSGDKAAFEATPILIEGTLYLSTPFNHVIALDPERGAERWTYDPKVDVSLQYSEVTSRGVSTWMDGDRKVGAPSRRRIFVATIDARLIALDATTGGPCKDFGQDGQLDLTRDIRVVGEITR